MFREEGEKFYQIDKIKTKIAFLSPFICSDANI